MKKAAGIITGAVALALPATGAIVLRDAGERIDAIRQAYHFRLPETPELVEEFIRDHPASDRVDEATLMLADWYFFSREYSLALSRYSAIHDDAFSGSTRQRMLYRKAVCQLKTGFYEEARAYFNLLRGSSEFGEAARFYTAYLDYVGGNYKEAYRQFKDIKASGPNGAEAEYYINQIDYLNGDFRKVASASERLLKDGRVPDELLAETMRVGGLSAFKTGDRASARRLLSQYASLAGDGAEISAIYSLASLYYDEGDYDRALPLFITVTEYPGQTAQSAWLFIGQIYASRGDSGAAALAFDKAARENWDDGVSETAAYNLAVSSTEGTAVPFSDAATAMEDFIETYPASPYASSLASYLANAYYGRRDYEKALRQVDKVSPRTPESTAMRQKILYQLGASRLRQGNPGEALRFLTEATGGPDREVEAQALLWMGDAQYAMKDYGAAARSYEKAISSGKLGDNTALARYNLGYAYMKLRDYRKAENAFKEASTASTLSRQQKADARLRYADCLYYTGKYAQALSLFRDIRLDGGSDAVFARIREADILGRDGKIADKISILESLATDQDAGVWRPTVLSRLADAYSEKGDDRRAAELYAQMLDSGQASTDNSQTYYSLATNADNLYKGGDKAAAYAAYKRLEDSGIAALYPEAVIGIMRTATDGAEIREYAARAATLPGLSADEMNEALFTGAIASLSLEGLQKENALTTLRSLARSTDRQWGARAAYELGEELLRQGDTRGAEEILLELIDNGSDDNYWLARGYIALADTYVAQDKDYLARLYLETLLKNYPGTEKDIRQMINSRLKTLDR